MGPPKADYPPTFPDLRQSPAYRRWMKFLGWTPIPLGQNHAYLKPLPLLGSVIKIQRPTGPLPFALIKKIADQNRALLVKIEPHISASEDKLLARLKKHHYLQDKWALIATRTILLDLRPDSQTIFKLFKKDCRSSIARALRAPILIHKNRFEDFYYLLHQSNSTKKLWTLPPDHYHTLIKSFGSQAFCLTATTRPKGSILAGCLVLTYKKTAFYFLAGSTAEGKHLHAPYLTVWEAIKEARRQGCTLWDFEGTYDERIPSTRSWKGFSHFKRSFGGAEISFPGSFTWYRQPLLRAFSPLMR